MMECETELQFKISGRVEGLSDRAIDTINVLNLGDNEKNNRALIGKRKQLSNVLFWKNGIDPGEGPELEDEELLVLLIEELSKPQDVQLEPFAPVVINILRSWLQT
jgi:DNA modification methylase